MTVKQIRLDPFRFDHNGLWECVKVHAGHRGTTTIAAGTDHEYETDKFSRSVEVYVSPTGRSVRVFVDGKEIKKPKQ